MQSHPAQQMSSQGQPPSQPPPPNQQQPPVSGPSQSQQQQAAQQQQQPPNQIAPPPQPGGPMSQQSQPPPHPSQMAPHPYIQYPQHHYYPHHPQQMQHPGPPMPHGPPPQHPHAPPHPSQHMMQPHPGQTMSQGPPHQPPPPPPYYQPVQHAGPPPQQHGLTHQMGPPHPSPYMQYPQHHYYPHHPQQMQPPPPPHAPHPGQQMAQGPPPPHHQSAYYQPVQHAGPPPQQHGAHPMAQNPYMQYPQHHYYPHHPQQMQHGPPPHHPHHPHHPQHMMQPHPSQQMVPHGPPQSHHPQYYQPAQPPPPPHGPPPQPHPAATGTVAGPPPMQSVQGPPPPPQPHTPQHNSGQPPPPQHLPPPASPHHPPSRTHTPQQPPPPSQTPTRVIPQPPVTPASPSIAQKTEKKEITFPKNSVEATKPIVTKRRKFTSKDVTDIEAWRLLMCLKSGLLAESSWAIDVLSILLNDDSTSTFFGLSNMPGMLEAVLEHFKCCLNEIFKDMAIRDTTLKPELSKPVSYSHWQEGNGEDTSHIQVYFDPENFIESSRRCICLSTILRNLSFIQGNDVEMSKHPGLLLVLGRILMYKPDDATYNEFESSPNEWHLLNSLREDTLVIVSNISSSLDLSPYNDKINLNLLKGLLHWACCSSTFALDPFPPPSMVSPQRLALESLAKLSIIEGNVDLILATPPWHRLDQLFEVLTNMLSMNEDQTVREFSLVLLSNLTAADSGIARRVALTGGAISRLVSFIERSINDQNENNMTTLDMLRRAAVTLKYLSQLVDNHQLFAQHQQRLLNLVMSGRLDQEVAPIIADVIFEISLSNY